METSQLQRLKQRYGIVGNDDALNRALEIALKISPVDLSVLIMGENGVGKEIFPRVIHDHSLRKGKNIWPSIVVPFQMELLTRNCSATKRGLLRGPLSAEKAISLLLTAERCFG